MRMTTRRTAIAGIAAATAATVATVLLLRKPPPPIFTPVVPPSDASRVPFEPIAAIRLTDPPAPLAAAPIFDAAGGSHRLDEFAGKGVVLNLWATWCVPCVAELPALAALATRLHDADVVVLPLSSDRGGADVVRRFYAAHGLGSLPIWLDPKGAAAQAWGAQALPTTFIIDRQGRERGRIEGAVDWASDAAIARVVALIG